MKYSDNELRLILSIMEEKMRAADVRDPSVWPELVASIAEMEEENPKLRSREYMLEEATLLFTNSLRERQLLRHPLDWYRGRINKMLARYPQPMLLIMTLGFLMDNFDDPTDFLEGGARLTELSTEVEPRY